MAIGDTDCTYDFEDLSKLFQAVADNGVDIVIGSRFDGEIQPGALPALHRNVGNPLSTEFLNACYYADFSDVKSGFRVLSREALKSMDGQSTPRLESRPVVPKRRAPVVNRPLQSQLHSG